MYPIRVCSICSEEFELKPDKPGFANRCPECSSADDSELRDHQKEQTNPELNAARRKAVRDLLYREDS